MRWIFKLFILGSFLLTGCTQLGTTKAPAHAVLLESSAESFVADKETLVPVSVAMGSQTMFEIMVAEILVHRGREAEAYSLIMPLAHKTQDLGLSQRAFELSLRTRDFAKIKEAADLLKSLSPDNPAVWRASYILSILKGDISQALIEWQTHAKLSQKPFEELFLTTVNRISKSVPQENGIAFLQGIKYLYPNEKAINYGIGTLALSYQNHSLAKKYLMAALSDYRNHESDLIYNDINLKLVSTYLGLGKFSEGLKSLESFMMNNPENIVFQEHYARLEVKAGFLVAAEKRYEKILQISPNSYSVKLSLALLQLERESYLEAEQKLRSLLEHPLYKNYATYYLGLSKKEQGKYQDSLSYLQKVTEPPFFIDAQIHIAEINFPKLGLEATLKGLKGLKTSSIEDKVKLLRAKAILYSSANNIKKALELYSEAINLVPKNIELLFAKSILLYETNQYKKYEAILKQVLSIDSQQVDALNALGYFYVEQGKNLDKAEILITQALKISPNAFYILDSKGWLRFTQGRYAEAKEWLIRALNIELDEEVIIHLIKTKWMLGEYQEAKELWQKHQDTYLKNTNFQSLIEGLKSK